MLAVDINVIVRVVADDDPEQSPRAVALFDREGIYLTKAVLLEMEWVLRFSYDLYRETIACFAKSHGTSKGRGQNDRHCRQGARLSRPG
jgi:predicted nucleic-acid-binding protein